MFWEDLKEMSQEERGSFMPKTIKENVLESIRSLTLEKDHKIKVGNHYDLVTSIQVENYKRAVGCYEGRVNDSFNNVLYDKYVYSLFAKDVSGVAMYDYLIAHGSFKNKEATSFKI